MTRSAPSRRSATGIHRLEIPDGEEDLITNESNVAQLLERHVARLRRCRACPRMAPSPVSGGPVVSKILLVGQAPGDKEPKLGRPFAWTAGRTLFRWFEEQVGIDEATFRGSIYMAAVCRCFPGKKPTGGDRVPDAEEIANCSKWMRDEFRILKPRLVIPVGKLAIARFLEVDRLEDVIGKQFRLEAECDVIPLPHPSGASPWPRMEPGRSLVSQALGRIRKHPAMRELLLER